MKRFYFLQIVLIISLFSACSSINAIQKTEEKSVVQSPTPNDNVKAQNSVNDKDAAENPASGERKNTFANLESEGTALPMERSDEQPANAACPAPDKPCQHKEKEFAEWELSFKLPARLAPNKTYSSAPFYAVILKTYESDEDCDGGEYIEALEKERKQLQKSQPERKVFAAYSCPNMDAVNYDFDGRWDKSKEIELIGNFIAVYGGQNETDAETLLRAYQKDYPNAVVKKMTVNWERTEQ